MNGSTSCHSCLARAGFVLGGGVVRVLCVKMYLYNTYSWHQIVLYISAFTDGLTHWGRVTHICVGKLSIIGPDNGLSPGRRQAIIRTNAGILLIRPLGTNFSEILIEIIIFSFKKMRFKVSSAKRRPFCLGLNVLKLGLHHIKWIFTK